MVRGKEEVKQKKERKTLRQGLEKDVSCLVIEISLFYFSNLHFPTSSLSFTLVVRSQSHLHPKENYNKLESNFVSCLSSTINLFFGSSNNNNTHQVSSKSLLFLKITEFETLSLFNHSINRDFSTSFFKSK